MKKSLIPAVILVVGLTMLGMSACSSPGGGESGPPNLERVRIDVTTAATSIDPIGTPYLTDSQLVGLTSASLFQFVRDSATETEPVLAQEAVPSADNTVWTVTLTPDLKFSDGSPLTSEDVVASLIRVRDTPGPLQADAAAISDVVATDDTTITITLTRPDGDLRQTLALPSFGIVSRDAAGSEEYFDDDPVFSGAYVPQTDYRSNTVELVRNEQFGGPRPAVESLVINVIGDTASSATRILGGDVDLVSALPQETVAQMTGELTSVHVDRVASLFIVPNNREGFLFSDPKLRQAIAWAIDRTALASPVYGQDVKPQYGPYPIPADYPQPIQIFNGPDLDRAKELLVGTACENGCAFSASYFGSSSEAEGRAGVVLQQMLAPLGMTVQPTPVEDQQFIQDSLDGSFDLNVVESGGFNVPGSFSGALDLATECIYSGCANDDAQATIDALLAAPPGQAQDDASRAMLMLFEEWLPIIPVAGSAYDYGIKANLTDSIGLLPNGLFWIAEA